MNFSTIFDDGVGGNQLGGPTGCTFIPLWYDEVAEGGAWEAEIEAHGQLNDLWPLLRLLGYRVRILNREASPVWWGYLNEVVVTLAAGLRVGLSLEEMANRTIVRYQIRNDAGVILRTNTAYADDTDSQAQYGTKERLASLRQVAAAQAEALRDSLLADLALPLAIAEPVTVTGLAPALLRCKGYISTLDWFLYDQPLGLVANDFDRTGALGGETQKLGQGFTDDTIGFARSGKISDLDGRMSVFARNDVIRVSGSSSNNGSFTVSGVENREVQSYTATTIFFDPTDDIHDSAEQLNFLDRDDFMTVSGSTSNDDVYRVKTVGGEHSTLAPSTVLTEAAGASITLARGNALTVTSALTEEYPGATVTITLAGQEISQAFTPASGAWTAAEVEIRAKKVGSPADSLQIELCADSAGNPGTVLDSATLTAANVLAIMDWLTFTLANTDTITNGTTYHLVVSRTGSNDPDNYYVVDLDPDVKYAAGGLKLYNGAAWVSRATAADLMFRVKGSQATTDQIVDLVDASEFLAGVDVVDASGISSWQYRDGASTGLNELLALLRSGTSNGQRLLARVSDDLHLRVWEQPARASVEPAIILGADRNLYNRTGGAVGHGRLCAGQWIDLAEVPPTVGFANRLTPLFVERAVMNCRDEVVTIIPAGMRAGATLGRILQSTTD